ncbi:hypothetical protein EUGRSUZ_G02839 [Eucalyptus grandis]|uniref:Uncharacterized protein n=2 Tax=Eucalyptus grandis TaxID=71139 RepID=A0ACC3K8G4_EUCGR|nr:hypothetical protein EUGRSUZ_G02839 [Eucalyptus grandis]
MVCLVSHVLICRPPTKESDPTHAQTTNDILYWLTNYKHTSMIKTRLVKRERKTLTLVCRRVRALNKMIFD